MMHRQRNWIHRNLSLQKSGPGRLMVSYFELVRSISAWISNTVTEPRTCISLTLITFTLPAKGRSNLSSDAYMHNYIAYMLSRYLDISFCARADLFAFEAIPSQRSS